jgi:hypothetical protein
MGRATSDSGVPLIHANRVEVTTTDDGVVMIRLLERRPYLSDEIVERDEVVAVVRLVPAQPPRVQPAQARATIVAAYIENARRLVQ